MKTRSWLILFLCLILLGSFTSFFSCSTVKKLAAFDVVYNFPKVTFTYPQKDLKGTQILLLKSKLSINFDSILNANHIPSGIIASAYLSRLAMVITAPPEATFNWISSVTMLGSADTSFQHPTTLGYETNIDPSSRTLNLTLPNVDIKPILFNNSYYIEVLATPSGQLPSSSSINMYLDSQVRLHIEPL